MTCRQLVELVTDYLDGRLTPAQHAAVHDHLRLCPGCDRYVDQFRTAIALLGELPRTALRADVRRRLYLALTAGG